MKVIFITIIIFFIATAIFAQIPFGGFSTPKAFRENTPDIIDSNFVLSPIAKSADPNDLDFRLEHKDERGRIRLFRKDIAVFADEKDYYVADGTHSFGAPRFRKLTRCEKANLSYFRRVSTAPAGAEGHSQNGIIETWVILDDKGFAVELTDKVVKQILLRTKPKLYNEYSDKNKRIGSPIDYIRKICD